MLTEGQAREGTYCAAVAHNGVWTIGDPALPGPISSVTIASSAGVIPSTVAWAASALGSYGVLLLSQEYGSGGTIVAARDPGVVPGSQLLGEPIPAALGLGLVVLLVAVALLGIFTPEIEKVRQY